MSVVVAASTGPDSRSRGWCERKRRQTFSLHLGAHFPAPSATAFAEAFGVEHFENAESSRANGCAADTIEPASACRDVAAAEALQRYVDLGALLPLGW